MVSRKLNSKKNQTPAGTLRVEARTLKTYQKTRTGWKKRARAFPELFSVVKLFKAHKKFSELVDAKHPQFLKGQLSPSGQAQGARIGILPSGEPLEKAFSLFAPHLRIHDQTSHDHWDVLYQNKGGTWSYVYTKAKRARHQARKYKKVRQFNKHYKNLVKSVKISLEDRSDDMALPLYTLLTTHMRMGNETYFKAHRHKGLATLTKNNIKVDVKRKRVTFDFIAKDGVPVSLTKQFPLNYINRLRSILTKKKKNEFVFTYKGRTLRDHDFKAAFLKHCGHEFYPHIVRSHYATMKVQEFLKKKRTCTKKECEDLFLSLAHELGHRKFNKKTQQWQDHYVVTINSYVQPELLEKLQRRVKTRRRSVK